jgi:hypothetical protein
MGRIIKKRMAGKTATPKKPAKAAGIKKKTTKSKAK